MVKTRGVGGSASGERRQQRVPSTGGGARVRQRARQGSASQGGRALLGFLTGLIVGLGIAVVVALFVTRAPVPFVNKGNRTAERPVEPRNGAALPEPNAPLRASQTDSGPGNATAPAAQGNVLSPGPTASLPGAGAGAGTPPSAAMPPDARRDEGGYMLQAGAFRASPDAEGMKARLALLGLEARVIPAEINGQPMYRVRIGPFAQQEEANRARQRLADGGIDASVIRQR
jgi:cell division protein FtsN